MKKIVSFILALALLITANSIVFAGTIDLEKLDKITLKILLDDGTIKTSDQTNKYDGYFSKAVKGLIDYYWNTYNVKEIQSINDIPLKDTQFASYAGTIDKNLKGVGYSNSPDVIKRVQEDESKSLKDVTTPKDNITIKVNGVLVKFDVAPYIKDGRTMVPFRAIFEALSAEVSYDFTNPSSKLVWGIRTVNGSKVRVDMKIGSKIAVKSVVGSITMDVAPEITGNRTFIPARYASELLGAKVDWNPDTREVIITI